MYTSAKVSNLVYQKFKDKKDLGGNDYIHHLMRVQARMIAAVHTAYIPEYAIHAALLHDIYEDTDVMPHEVIEAAGEECASIVGTLTKIPGEKYEDYISQIVDSKNPYAIMIKLFDLIDNMDVLRLPGFTEKDAKRIAKYHKAYRLLSKEIEKYQEQLKLKE